MKSPVLLALFALIALPVALLGCGTDENPSTPAPIAIQTQAITATDDCLNDYLGGLSSVLLQWETALEEERGFAFLATPPSFAGEVDAYLTAVSPLLVEWEDSLETWSASDLLETPPVFEEDVNAYLSALSPVLVSWRDSLETWRDKEFLPAPPAFTADTTPPEITCPADTTVDCSGPDGMVVEFDVVVTDSCDSNPMLVCEPPSGSVFAVGTTAVACTATDANGNSSECTFSLTVVMDDIAPEIACSPDTVLECTGNGQAVYEFAATVSDNCDPDPTVVCEPPSGSGFPLGATTVTCTATDAAGNSSSCSFTVTVVDTQPPSIEELAVDTPAIWPPNHKMTDISVHALAVDACEGEVECWVESISSNEPADGRGDGHTDPDWEIVGPLDVRVRAERQGMGEGRVYTLLVMCSDSSGNTAEGSVEVRIPHDSGD